MPSLASTICPITWLPSDSNAATVLGTDEIQSEKLVRSFNTPTNSDKIWTREKSKLKDPSVKCVINSKLGIDFRPIVTN